MSDRMSIRVVKLAAIVLATVGLAILWFAATRAEVPTVAIGRAGATMNLAYVRVEGRCTRVPSYDSRTGYLSFWIADETGELHVASYRAETQVLIEEGRVPALGDRVVVAGTLRIREDFRSLTVNAPEEVVIARPEPEACSIEAIAPEQIYRRVRVQGQVRQVVEPYEGLRLITVRDGTSVIDVALSDDLIALSGITPTLEIGQPIEVVAAVSQYRGTAQLVPASVADVVPLDHEVLIAARRFVMELSRGDVGDWVGVRGTVLNVTPFSKGVKLTLDDGTGAVTVLLWQDVCMGLQDELGGGPELTPGAEIEAQGEIAEYRGELEIIPELPADVRVLSITSQDWATVEETVPVAPTSTPPSAELPAPTTTVRPTVGATPTPMIDLVPIPAITADRVGEMITVQGTVVDAVSFSDGFKLTLDDGQGRIVLLMWHDVYDGCSDGSQIGVGATVRATGEVSQYEGQLQIEPRSGGDVKVEEIADVQPARREIGSISAADEGQWVMVEGEVARTERLSSAVKVFLADDEPAAQDGIPVFIWHNVLNRIAENGALSISGSRVCVVGRLQVYQGNLEIVPALPSDVTVLEVR
jgi:DNA/RNA endonuclease YhcR with UshA esterase domain